MAAGKGWWQDFGERRAAIGRVGHTREVVAIVVVVIDHDGVVTRFGAVPHIAFALRATAARGAATIADNDVWGESIATHLIPLAGGVGPGYHTALHEDQASAHIVLFHQVTGGNLRAVYAGRGHLGQGRRRVKDTRNQYQDWWRNVRQHSVCSHLYSLLSAFLGPKS